MASRFSPRRLLKPLAYGVGLAGAGGTVMYITYRPRNVPGADSMAPKPPKRDENGHIIPPHFPKIQSRAEQIAQLKKSSSSSTDVYDLLVIGGGATGTGIALDAATRGLKVAVVDRDDFSSGTSSKSTKLVHGGVRYLEKAVWNLDYNQYQLVREALHERKSFLYTAPHLSSWLPIMLPLQKWWQAPYFWAGTKFYDLLAGSEGIESSYFLPRSKALDAFPMLRKDNLIGALVYYDGQHNDSRMNISLAMTAHLYGATTVNHLEVTSLEKDANGQLIGAQVRDLVAEKNGDKAGKESFSIKAKGIINATGPFADAIEQMDEPTRKEIVSPSLGVHVVLPGYLSPQDMGLIDPSTSDGRVIFFLPWQGNTIAGTTDAPCSIEQNPIAGEKDIEWILDEIRTYLTPDIEVQRSDILAAWSGIRPLVRDPHSKNTESLVRSHLVNVSPSGLVTCAGGKWTTYRQMAEDAVDKAIEVFKLQTKPLTYVPDISGVNGTDPSVQILNGTCQTHHIRLLGAHGYSTTLFINLIQQFGLETEVAKHIATNYGDRAWDVAALSSPVENSPFPLRGQRLSPLYPFVDGEVRFAVRSEYAETAIDVLARRTRLSFLNAQAALQALPRVIDIMAEELKWSKQRKETEWTDGVKFLESMGLPRELLQISRAEVEKGLNVGRTKGLVSYTGSDKSASPKPLKNNTDSATEASAPLP